MASDPFTLSGWALGTYQDGLKVDVYRSSALRSPVLEYLIPATAGSLDGQLLIDKSVW